MTDPFGLNSPTPEPPRRITPLTRRNVLDWLALSGHSWAGRLDDEDFLGRLYNLSALGSTDTRFSDAAGDIWQHRTNNYDWDDDWVFTDPRFNLRDGSDENLLGFLVETVHPVVRRDQTEADALVRGYNETLRPDGFELVETSRMGDRSVYGWRHIAAVRTPAASPLRDHPNLADKAVLIQHLDRIQRDLDSDPSAAISSSKNLLETLCKIVLTDRGVDYTPADTLPGLFSKVASELSINAESVPDDARASDSIRKMMRALTTTVQAVAEARNSTLGDGHGGERESPAEPRHARLIYNATTAVAEFIVDTWTA
ncbi:abortive infection family protein [uncultured Microbacterium sp.]|uniref:abortive infection family protein n=1 Tax=uncultured Microbacterium sp. TaxID=191216 RepID=UPI0028E86014|nr:abortive infection family protein [uncultured Microbacterium sp.]